VFGPIGHVVLQGGPKMSDAKPVLLISLIVLQPAIVPVSSQRREVRSNMQGRDLRTFWHRAIHIGQRVSTGWAKNSNF